MPMYRYAIRNSKSFCCYSSRATSSAWRLIEGNLPGIALIPVVQRVYPNGGLAAQVLGFVRTSNGTGQYGVEQAVQPAAHGATRAALYSGRRGRSSSRHCTAATNAGRTWLKRHA